MGERNSHGESQGPQKKYPNEIVDYPRAQLLFELGTQAYTNLVYGQEISSGKQLAHLETQFYVALSKLGAYYPLIKHTDGLDESQIYAWKERVEKEARRRQLVSQADPVAARPLQDIKPDPIKVAAEMIKVNIQLLKIPRRKM